tara:strand:- start:375 stop:539 length:165 start_codon:yes stop_codon:yes gene_type:complete
MKNRKPHYNIYSSASNRMREEQKRKDAFAWKVGIFIMTIISCVGIYAIYWAATL